MSLLNPFAPLPATFQTKDGEAVTIVAFYDGYALGVLHAGGKQYAQRWNLDGVSVNPDDTYCHNCENLVDPLTVMWTTLEPNMRSAIRDICKLAPDNRIATIKIVRALTGWGLTDSKKLVCDYLPTLQEY